MIRPIYTMFLALLVALFVGLGIDAFYPGPEPLRPALRPVKLGIEPGGFSRQLDLYFVFIGHLIFGLSPHPVFSDGLRGRLFFFDFGFGPSHAEEVEPLAGGKIGGREAK